MKVLILIAPPQRPQNLPVNIHFTTVNIYGVREIFFFFLESRLSYIQQNLQQSCLQFPRSGLLSFSTTTALKLKVSLTSMATYYIL